MGQERKSSLHSGEQIAFFERDRDKDFHTCAQRIQPTTTLPWVQLIAIEAKHSRSARTTERLPAADLSYEH